MSSARAVFLAALLGVTACGGGSDLSAPLSGPLDLVLQTPADDDGIVLVEVVGGTVDSVTALGYRTESSSVGTAPIRIVVSGALRTASWSGSGCPTAPARPTTRPPWSRRPRGAPTCCRTSPITGSRSPAPRRDVPA